jgi:transposase-like protein
MLTLDKTPVEIKCPSCGQTNEVTLGQVRKQATVVCRGCRCEFQLKDKDNSVQKAENEMKNFAKTFQNMFK